MPEVQWEIKKVKVNLPIGFYSGINLLDDQDIIDKLIESIKKQWDRNFEYKDGVETDNRKSVEENISAETVELLHDKVKDMIFEIGKTKNM